MKKYIKTKDGRIVEVFDNCEEGYYIETHPIRPSAYSSPFVLPIVPKDQVVRIADSIEELCNEFPNKRVKKKKKYVADDVDRRIREREAALDACGDFGENGL